MKTGYLIDMDGVIYRENNLIPGAVDFVRALEITGTPFLFLTNNSALPVINNSAPTARSSGVGAELLVRKRNGVPVISRARTKSTAPGIKLFSR